MSDTNSVSSDDPVAPLSIYAILEDLSIFAPPFPEESLLAARTRREEITPILLDTLKRIIRESDDEAEAHEDEDLYWYVGLLLLAEFKEKAAAPLLLEMCHLPEDTLWRLINDGMTEDLPTLLYALCGDDPDALLALVRDENAGVWARDAAMSVLKEMIDLGEWPLEAFRALCEEMLRLFIATAPSVTDKGRQSRATVLPTEVAISAAEKGFIELRPLIEEVMAVGLFDPMVTKPDDIFEELEAAANGASRSALPWRKRIRPMDATTELRRWSCYRPDPRSSKERKRAQQALLRRQAEKERKQERLAREVADPYYGGSLPAPPIRAQTKVGPNAPCPCGSGKKHKRCCGR